MAMNMHGLFFFDYVGVFDRDVIAANFIKWIIFITNYASV